MPTSASSEVTYRRFASVYQGTKSAAALGNVRRNTSPEGAPTMSTYKLFEAAVALVLPRASVARQEHCPIGDLLTRGEGPSLEYKSTLRTAASTGEKMPVLETAVVKTIAAFANSTEGGTLLIGVADDGSVHGLHSDYTSLRKAGKDDQDLFRLHLNQLLNNALGVASATDVRRQMHTVEGKDLCRVHVPPSDLPVEANVKVDERGQQVKKTLFYVRSDNSTIAITDPAEKQKYLHRRWGTPTAAVEARDPDE